MKSIKAEIRLRFSIIYWIIAAIAACILFQILKLQFYERGKWMEKAKAQENHEYIIPAQRGDICARDGKVMVSSVPYFEIRMDMKSEALHDTTFKRHIDQLAGKLASLFKDSTKTKKDYLEELKAARKKGERYHLVKKKVSFSEYKKLRKFPILKLGRYKGGLLDSVYIIRNRYYKNLALRTIGRIQKDAEKERAIGIEGAYDALLRGKDGVSIKSGYHPFLADEDIEIEPVDGKDLYSTIDINIQDVTENALLRQLIKNKADHGVAIVMEVKSGDILAIANLADTTDGNRGGYAETFNFAIGEPTEPGSTFKLASMIAAFEDGYLEMNDSVDTQDGILQVGDFTIRDSKTGGYGIINLKEAFENSSNVGIAKLIMKCYKNQPEKFVDRLYSLTLNRKLGIDLPGEGLPYIKYPKDKSWSFVSLPQMSIGYEVKLTPMQILTFYNAIANDGKMVKPKFIKAIVERGEVIKNFESDVIKGKICSEKTLKKVRKMLEGVVENGTATNLKNNFFKIAGKTGTAKIFDAKSGEYIDKYKASFVGYFPADIPKYTIYVMIYAPLEFGYYGNVVAGPVFKEIAEKIYATSPEFQFSINQFANTFDYKNTERMPYLKNGNKNDLEYILKKINIPRKPSSINADWVSVKKSGNSLDYSTLNISKNIIPSVTGMGARDAISLLENMGLKVTIEGKGKVVNQSIPPGNRFKKGQEIKLEMGRI